MYIPYRCDTCTRYYYKYVLLYTSVLLLYSVYSYSTYQVTMYLYSVAAMVAARQLRTVA